MGPNPIVSRKKESCEDNCSAMRHICITSNGGIKILISEKKGDQRQKKRIKREIHDQREERIENTSRGKAE